MSGPAGEAGSIVARAAALGALVLIAILAALLLLGDGGDNTYRLRFETGGQLVPGNEVRIGGSPVGSVNSIELTDDNQAEIEVSVAEPITEGTTAVIRSTSLSGIANRYVSLVPGPGAALDENAVLTGEQTTTPVDLTLGDRKPLRLADAGPGGGRGARQQCGPDWRADDDAG